MFYKKKYENLRHKLCVFINELEVQQRQYESRLNRKFQYELTPEGKAQVEILVQLETLLKHTNSCLEELNKMLEEK